MRFGDEKYIRCDTEENTSPSNIDSEIYTKDRIYLTDPSRKFYTYMIKCEITTKELKLCFMQSERLILLII
jgi:hypothetical protein